jgi:UDP-N-acetylmuramate dehydrogenase
MSEIIATIRAEKLPDWNVIGTAGSFFANPFVCIQHFKALQEKYPEIPFWEVDSSLQPAVSAQNDEGCTKEVVKLSAGRLIEKAGLKGYSNGKAGTSPNHSLIVINQ